MSIEQLACHCSEFPIRHTRGEACTGCRFPFGGQSGQVWLLPALSAGLGDVLSGRAAAPAEADDNCFLAVQRSNYLWMGRGGEGGEHARGRRPAAPQTVKRTVASRPGGCRAGSRPPHRAVMEGCSAPTDIPCVECRLGHIAHQIVENVDRVCYHIFSKTSYASDSLKTLYLLITTCNHLFLLKTTSALQAGAYKTDSLLLSPSEHMPMPNSTRLLVS